jgi:hypothetical protein
MARPELHVGCHGVVGLTHALEDAPDEQLAGGHDGVGPSGRDQAARVGQGLVVEARIELGAGRVQLGQVLAAGLGSGRNGRRGGLGGGSRRRGRCCR